MKKRTYALTDLRPGEEDHFFIEALDRKLWQPTAQAAKDGQWDMRWQVGMPSALDFARIDHTRMINHIPGNGCLTVKSALADTLTRLSDRLSASHGPEHPITQRSHFIPATYSMPRDHAQYLAAVAAAPDALWLLKPKNSSRGRGIRLLSDPTDVPMGDEWLIQRYLHNPHLIDGRKYVLRLYVLIRGLEPLRVYRYAQGFAKLASHAYTLDDLTDPFIHQTNPDINATNTGVNDPVVFIDLKQYAERITAEGHDSDALFARIDQLLAITAIAARETMRTETLAAGADPEGCFELMGIDCLIDQSMNPWLLECNLNPSLGVFAGPDDGGETEAQVKRTMVHDLVSLVGLNDPHRSRMKADDPADTLAAKLAIERSAAGDFRCLYPGTHPAALAPFFDCPRPADTQLASALGHPGLTAERLVPWQVKEHITDDQLTLTHTGKGITWQPNATASLIWLHVTDGLSPEQIAEMLYTPETPASLGEIAMTIHQAIADWCAQGLLRQAGPADMSDAATPKPSR